LDGPFSLEESKTQIVSGSQRIIVIIIIIIAVARWAKAIKYGTPENFTSWTVGIIG